MVLEAARLDGTLKGSDDFLGLCGLGCGSEIYAPRRRAEGSDMISWAAVDWAVVLEAARLDGTLKESDCLSWAAVDSAVILDEACLDGH